MRTLRRGVMVGLLVAGGALAMSARVAWAYLYQQDVITTRYVDDIRVSDVAFSPPSIRIDWSYTPVGTSTVHYDVQRVVGGTTTDLGLTTNQYYIDSFSYAFGTQ